MTPGEKIKKLRRERHMTQEALAGEQITRNMLSQIEKGSAQPSLPTLIYLADRLEMPVGYFFCEEEEELSVRKMRIMPRLRELFCGGAYTECLRLFERELGECDDELGYLMATASFFCGKKAWQNGAFESALGYFTNALDYTEDTVSPIEWIRAGCRILMPIAANVQSPLLEMNEQSYMDALRAAGCTDEYAYLMEKDTHVFENRFYAEHLRARALLRASHFSEALSILERIEAQKGAEEITAFLLFRTYLDMEVCYRELGNYEGAYRYASKRLSLLAAFRS